MEVWSNRSFFHLLTIQQRILVKKNPLGDHKELIFGFPYPHTRIGFIDEMVCNSPWFVEIVMELHHNFFSFDVAYRSWLNTSLLVDAIFFGWRRWDVFINYGKLGQLLLTLFTMTNLLSFGFAERGYICR